METYDVKCPICGTVNRRLYLEETQGWMECKHCLQTVKVLNLAAEKNVPLYTPQQLIACFAAAN